jgi:GNAT superfamily N-acetyltransferase
MACLLSLRPAVAGDRAALEAMHARCSTRSRTARWRAPLPRIPRGYLCDALAGRKDHVALVVETARGDLVALASAVGSDGRWELGILVEDRYQRRGLGRCLASRLLCAVRSRGGTAVIAEVGHDSRGLLAALAHAGPVRVAAHRDGLTGVVDLTTGEDGGGGGRRAAEPTRADGVVGSGARPA